MFSNSTTKQKEILLYQRKLSLPGECLWILYKPPSMARKDRALYGFISRGPQFRVRQKPWALPHCIWVQTLSCWPQAHVVCVSYSGRMHTWFMADIYVHWSQGTACPTPTGNGIASPFLVLLLRNGVSLCIPGYSRFPCYPGCYQNRSNPPASALPSSSNSKYKSQYPISVSSFFIIA